MKTNNVRDTTVRSLGRTESRRLAFRHAGLLAIVALGIASFLVLPMLSDRVVHRLKNPSTMEKEAAPEKDQEKRGEQPLDADDE